MQFLPKMSGYTDIRISTVGPGLVIVESLEMGCLSGSVP